MSTLLFTIATGKTYRDYAKQMFTSAKKFWPEVRTLVFTDEPCEMVSYAHQAIHTEPKGYPGETLYRYHTLLQLNRGKDQWMHEVNTFAGHSHIFYADADMEFVAPVGDVLSYGLVATLHPGFVGKKGSPETRPESWAYCKHNTAYYCGGFQGGSTESYLTAAKSIAVAIDDDARRNITAVWHDESHWNRYLADNPPSKILSPSYCYPEDYAGQWGWKPEDHKPILVALDKNKRNNHWSQNG